MEAAYKEGSKIDVNDLCKILKGSEDQLTHILNDCKEGSAWLVLIASEMDSILEILSSLETELSSSISDTEVPTKTAMDTDFGPEE